MRFFTDRHRYYCGIDLHARSMYLCIQNQEGQVVLHRNMEARPEPFLKAIEPFKEDVVVGVECIFTWYWLADLCAEHKIPFILGHALYMKAIHGGKAKNDRGICDAELFYQDNTGWIHTLHHGEVESLSFLRCLQRFCLFCPIYPISGHAPTSAFVVWFKTSFS